MNRSGTSSTASSVVTLDDCGRKRSRTAKISTVTVGTMMSGITKLTRPRNMPAMMYLLVSGVESSKSMVPESRSRVSVAAAVFVTTNKMIASSIQTSAVSALPASAGSMPNQPNSVASSR